MSFFVDANVPVYAATGFGGYGEPCARIMRAVSGGADGRTSTTALGEIWHLELSGRLGRLAGLTERTLAVLSPILPVTEEVCRAALTIVGENLGAADRIHVATCLTNGIEVIVSADKAFDSIEGIRRVDPLDQAAVADLLPKGHQR